MSRTIATIDPNEWAQKRKEAMEKAKRIRAEREIAQADHPYAPQMVKRISSNTKRFESEDSLGTDEESRIDFTCSLDILANKGGLRFDVGETLAPSPRHPLRGDSSKAPSPGSDALGMELKRFPSNHAYDKTSGRTSEKTDHPGQREQHFASASTLPPADEIFLSSLRSDRAQKGKPGWNDDFISSEPEPSRRRSSEVNRQVDMFVKPSPRLSHPIDERRAEAGQLKSR